MTNSSKNGRESYLFDRATISDIQRAAKDGIYKIRGFGAKRKLPHFDDLVFLGASVSRYPLEGYRETCGTNVELGTRFSEKPLCIDIPITIAGIGSRDSLVILMFSLNNINIEDGILFSSLYLIIFNFGTYFFGFLSTMIKPLKIK